MNYKYYDWTCPECGPNSPTREIMWQEGEPKPRCPTCETQMRKLITTNKGGVHSSAAEWKGEKK